MIANDMVLVGATMFLIQAIVVDGIFSLIYAVPKGAYLVFTDDGDGHLIANKLALMGVAVFLTRAIVVDGGSSLVGGCTLLLLAPCVTLVQVLRFLGSATSVV